MKRREPLHNRNQAQIRSPGPLHQFIQMKLLGFIVEIRKDNIIQRVKNPLRIEVTLELDLLVNILHSIIQTLMLR